MHETTGDYTLETLDDHRKLTTQVARDLGIVRDAASELGLDEVTERTTELLRRTQEQVFRIAVVGEFKRGKSTLINALLGREVLPADVLPCSATLNRVTYGLKPSVKLRFKPDADGNEREETIGIDELEAWVTKLTPESEQQAADVREAVVSYPVRYCRDKADIIDTPGLNDDANMTDVTMAVLPTVDAAVLVILAQSPFSNYEADFLNRLMTHDMGRVLFVVNRMDEIRRAKDKVRVLDVIRGRIKKAVATRAAELHGEGSAEAAALVAQLGEPRIFGVSGADALDGKLEDDPDLLARSGFPEFEEALERFLTMERGLVALTLLADTTASSASKVHSMLAIRRGAIQLEATKFESVWAENQMRLTELNSDYQAELRRMDRAAAELADTLRPMARRLGDRMVSEAGEVIDAYPLDAEAIDKDRVEDTQKKMMAAISQRLQALGRIEAERLNEQIQKGMVAEIERLQGFSQKLTESLRAIEVDFQPEVERDEQNDMDVLAGGLFGLSGMFAGGGLGGAFVGYRVAGLEGAAVGGVTGVAVGAGTTLGLVILATTIGLPITWPVALPILAVAGLTATFGGKKVVESVFSGRRVDKFREAMKDGTLRALETQGPARARALAAGIDEQVETAFTTLREHVEGELGAAIRTTKATLEQLHTQRTRSEAEQTRDLADLTRLEDRLRTIETANRDLLCALKENA
ncbi:MAG: dynamin family protein [Proteobacteria bacterium]|nr:dynamin family protein [Pseudomonadota bacterium]